MAAIDPTMYGFDNDIVNNDAVSADNFRMGICFAQHHACGRFVITSTETVKTSFLTQFTLLFLMESENVDRTIKIQNQM